MEAVLFGGGLKRAPHITGYDSKKVKRVLGSVDRVPLPAECHTVHDVLRGMMVAEGITVNESYVTKRKNNPTPDFPDVVVATVVQPHKKQNKTPAHDFPDVSVLEAMMTPMPPPPPPSLVFKEGGAIFQDEDWSL